MNKTTNSDLQAIRGRNEERKRLKAEASPGPWQWTYDYQMGNRRTHWCLSNPERFDGGVRDGRKRTINHNLVTLASYEFEDSSIDSLPLSETPDFRLIVAARNDTPENDIDALLWEIGHLEELLKDRCEDLEFEHKERVAAEEELEQLRNEIKSSSELDF